jgi:peptide/nickel transport system substrate-binding protein
MRSPHCIVRKAASASLLGLALGFSTTVFADTPKDVLVIAQSIDNVITMDPAEALEEGSYEMIPQLYDSLFRFDAAAESKIGNGLVESWNVSSDGLTYRFKLRSGLKFASGNPITAEDAVFAIQRTAILKKSPVYVLSQIGLDADNVKASVKALSTDELSITLAKKFSPDLVIAILSSPFTSVVDKKVVLANEQAGDLGNGWLRTHSAGSGPFELVAWKPNESITFKAFDGYRTGKPAMSRIVIRHVKEAATQKLLLEHKDVDIALNLSPDQLADLKDSDGIKVQRTRKGQLVYIALNQKDPQLRSPKLWEAMRYLIDYEGIAKTILRGQYEVHQTFWGSGSWASLGTAPYHLDVAKAKALLAEAGLSQGLTLDVNLPNGFPYLQIGQAVQATMAQAGIKLELSAVETRQYITRYRARQQTVTLGFWGPDFVDPQANAAAFASNLDNSDASGNKGVLPWRNSWEIPDLTARTMNLSYVFERPKREKAYLDLQADIQTNSPFIVMFQRTEQLAMRDNVRGLVSGPQVFQIYFGGITK